MSPEQTTHQRRDTNTTETDQRVAQPNSSTKIEELHLLIIQIQLVSLEYSTSAYSRTQVSLPRQYSTMEQQMTEDDGIMVGDVYTGIQDDCEITLLYNHVRFIIVLKRSHSKADEDGEDSIEEDMLKELDDSDQTPDPMAYDLCLEKIQELAIAKSKDMIYKLASKRRDNGNITLEESLFPKTFVLQLRTVREELRVEQLGDIKKAIYNHDNVYLQSSSLTFDKRETQFVSVKDIEVIENPNFQKFRKVSWKGVCYAFKSASKGNEKQLVRELEALRKISKIEWPQKDSLQDPPRIPRLHAIVESKRGVVGFLEDYIESTGNLFDYINGFDYLGIPEATEEEKKRWIRQIEKEIQFLHQHAIVWGDAKAENVLIDKKRNAWLIDFGGSWTQGWVDRELNETMEGDLQGLERIRARLNGVERESDDCPTPTM